MAVIYCDVNKIMQRKKFKRSLFKTETEYSSQRAILGYQGLFLLYSCSTKFLIKKEKMHFYNMFAADVCRNNLTTTGEKVRDPSRTVIAGWMDLAKRG